MKVEVQNIVITVFYPEVKLDLNYLVARLPVDRTTYDSWAFPGLRFKDKWTCLIFRTGKVVIPGLRAVDDIIKAKEWITELLEDMVGKLPEPIVQVRNIVASVDFERDIDFERIAEGRGLVYEPTIFPGMIVPYKEKNVLVFPGGKAVLPGMKSIEELNDAVKWLTEFLEVKV